MFTLGITGGIGSGKTLVSQHLISLGVPVYNSDKKAKEIMLLPKVKANITKLLGKEAYLVDSQLNRTFISQKVFGNQKLLQELNSIVHPVVQLDFLEWKKQQNTKIIGIEAAVLFESGSYKPCDAVLLVTADLEIRIKRVIERDNLTRQQILERIHQQWSETKKCTLADYIIYNNGSKEELYLKITKIVEKIELRIESYRKK